jgi:hypothetical protein
MKRDVILGENPFQRRCLENALRPALIVDEALGSSNGRPVLSYQGSVFVVDLAMALVGLGSN